MILPETLTEQLERKRRDALAEIALAADAKNLGINVEELRRKRWAMDKARIDREAASPPAPARPRIGPDIIASDPRMGPKEVRLFIAAHRFCRIKDLRKKPWTVAVSVDELTVEARIGKKSCVEKTLRKILDAGWMKKKRRGRMERNRYQLFPAPKPPIAQL